MRWDFVLWFAACGAAGGILGEVVVKERVERAGKCVCVCACRLWDLLSLRSIGRSILVEEA